MSLISGLTVTLLDSVLHIVDTVDAECFFQWVQLLYMTPPVLLQVGADHRFWDAPSESRYSVGVFLYVCQFQIMWKL